MYSIAQWYHNYQAPSVLMIDDLSDSYINVYNHSYKNDWGYLCEDKHSAYDFLHKNLLQHYPSIKITFFVPYAKHNVINPTTQHAYKTYAIGERKKFSTFLSRLVKKGHEIAHHGSNHGQYKDINNLRTLQNFQHEWELFHTVQEGVSVTQQGVQCFQEYSNISVVGGKFCGYKTIENSLEIINQCQFNYWCCEVNFSKKEKGCYFFGHNHVLSFPTNFSGNSFVRLSYKTGDKKRDNKKKFFKYLQPFYNLFAYQQLNHLYKHQHIISIQEHISPATTSGNIQSANIVSDIQSLNKLYTYLKKKSIWYATCEEISNYVYIRENTSIEEKDSCLTLTFNNHKNLNINKISIVAKHPFSLKNSTTTSPSKENNQEHVVSIEIQNGTNNFKIIKDKK